MKTLADIAPTGDRRKILEAMRDRLAEETNDIRWAKHKAECRCACGIGDGRVLVALAKELRAVIAELDALPGGEERSPLDDVVDNVTKLDSERRTRRPKAARS